MDTPDIAHAIDEVLKGDIDRFETVIRLLQDDVWKIVSYARLDWSMARDIVQQTFVDAYTHLDQYDRNRDFSLWVKGIARNLVRQTFRRAVCKSRHLAVYRADVESSFENDVAAEGYEQGRLGALERCRKKLPGKYQRVVDLYYEGTIPMETVAKRVGSTVTAVKQLLWRARVMLRQCIEAQLAKNS